MAWIESHQELALHPKTRRMARLLGIGIPAAVGHLHLLWWWAMNYAQDGDLSPFEDADVAEACLWEGNPTVFLEALGTVGFLDGDGEAWVIHDWDEYAGRLMDRRRANAERARTSRARRAPVTGLQNPTEPNRTVPNPTEPSEAKASSPPKRKPELVPLTLAERQKLVADFPDIPEVNEEIDRALAHESHLKYPTGQYLYVRGWLRRAREPRGGTHGTANQRRRIGAVVVSNGSDWEAADRARDLLPRRLG